MSEGLCWKCREIFTDLDISEKQNGLDLRPWLHCHHEPKEKPVCLCKVIGLTKIRLKIGEIMGPDIFDYSRIKFCPECGGRLAGE